MICNYQNGVVSITHRILSLDTCFQCPSWTAIAEVQPQTVRNAILYLNDDDVDAILQIGTNLSAVKLAAELEQSLSKPVIAINTATYWHALRANSMDDKLEGLGD